MSRRAGWTIGTVLAVGCGVPQLSALRTMGDLGTNLLCFEFVATTDRAREALVGWGNEGRDAARTQLVWDFGFLAGYGLLLAMGALAARTGRLGLVLAVGAALADVCENVALLVVLDGTVAQPWPALATTFAALKFAAIGGCLVVIARTWLRRRSGQA